MHFEELISHPYLHPLVNKFPKIELKMNIIYFVWRGYTGIGMDVDDVKVILEKCLKENKYFKVWNMKWKGKIQDLPNDWWEGKVAYYKYKG